MDLTRIDRFDGWCAKREDTACWVSLDHPSGSKVRQYMQMMDKSPHGASVIVGCASHSCMQIYAASAAKLAGRRAHIHVPQRKSPTDATWYAIKMDAYLYYHKPAWMNVIRRRARDHGKELGQVVRWLPQLALQDAAEQAQNIPPWVKRVVIPTGSGLTAAGVIAGLAARERVPAVLMVAVSKLADPDDILDTAAKFAAVPKGFLIQHFDLDFRRERSEYGRAYSPEKLPDGTPLDPYYAAKAYDHLVRGDCLWIPGLRPVAAMPSEWRAYFKNWKGFK